MPTRKPANDVAVAKSRQEPDVQHGAGDHDRTAAEDVGQPAGGQLEAVTTGRRAR